MVSSNPGNLELKDLDNTFSIDVIKPFPTNSNYMSSVSSSSSYPTVRMENSSQSGTTIKLLKGASNSPRTNSNNNNNKPNDPNPPSINPSEKANAQTNPPSIPENNNIANTSSNDDKGKSKDEIKQTIKPNVQKEELRISIQMNSENKPEIMTDEHEVYPASGKRKLDIDDTDDNIKKKVHSENPGPLLFEDDEQDIMSFIRILDDNEVSRHFEEPEDQLESMGIKILPGVVEPDSEKQRTSPSKKLSLSNQQVRLSPEKAKVNLIARYICLQMENVMDGLNTIILDFLFTRLNTKVLRVRCKHKQSKIRHQIESLRIRMKS